MRKGAWLQRSVEIRGQPLPVKAEPLHDSGQPLHTFLMPDAHVLALRHH